jgi:hypothetical protein
VEETLKRVVEMGKLTRPVFNFARDSLLLEMRLLDMVLFCL